MAVSAAKTTWYSCRGPVLNLNNAYDASFSRTHTFFDHTAMTSKCTLIDPNTLSYT